jgi:branched-chain amino acid transport system permease protein
MSWIFTSIINNPFFWQIFTMCCINVIIVLGLNIISGITGQLSLGHAAFVSIGAYTAALLLKLAGLNFWLALPLAGLSAGVAGYLLAAPVMRLRGDYLAIATLGFCEIVRVIFLNLPITGRALGINSIPRETTPLIAFVVMIIAIIAMINIVHSRFGLALKSIREDEIASEMMGINIARYKMLAFAIGSCFAGVGGVLYACQITIITPGDFGFMRSVEYLCMVVLGGLGSIVGVVVGSSVLTTAPEILRSLVGSDASAYRMVLYGIVIIMIMVFRPQGLFGKIKVNM